MKTSISVGIVVFFLQVQSFAGASLWGCKTPSAANVSGEFFGRAMAGNPGLKTVLWGTLKLNGNEVPMRASSLLSTVFAILEAESSDTVTTAAFALKPSAGDDQLAHALGILLVFGKDNRLLHTLDCENFGL